jgi:hypothetical protein
MNGRHTNSGCLPRPAATVSGRTSAARHDDRRRPVPVIPAPDMSSTGCDIATNGATEIAPPGPGPDPGKSPRMALIRPNGDHRSRPIRPLSPMDRPPGRIARHGRPRAVATGQVPDR